MCHAKKFLGGYQMQDSLDLKISDLLSLDLEQVDIDTLKRKISSLVDGFSVVLMPWFLEKVYRARISDNGVPWKTKKDLWYPETVKVRGRCNDKNESIFYCSSNFETALIEKSPNIGDIVTVMECRKRDYSSRLLLQTLGITAETINLKPDLEQLKQDNDLLNMYIKHRELDEEKQCKIDMFLHDQYIQIVNPGDEYKYRITNLISKLFMGHPRAHGIIYPSIYHSVLAEFNGLNLAIKPEVADRILYPYRYFIFQILDITPDCRFKIKPIDVSDNIDENDNVVWSKNRSIWYFTAHNSRMIKPDGLPNTITTACVGDERFLVNEQKNEFPYKPYLMVKGKIVYIPFQYALVLGFGVGSKHIPEDNSYIGRINRDNYLAEFKTGSPFIKINGVEFDMGASPELEFETIYIPDIMFAKAIGAKLERENENTVHFII